MKVEIYMTRFKKWIIYKIFAEEVVQGYFHEQNIINIFRMLRQACKNEFTEDNESTLNNFLFECFEKSKK